MLRLFAIVLTMTSILAAPVRAQGSVNELVSALMLPELVAIMRQEGLASADELFATIPGGASEEVVQSIDEIYDTERMIESVNVGMARVLQGNDASALIAFFSAGLGKEIIQLEMSARRAFLDDDVETASKEVAASLETDDPERYALLSEFIEINDLIDNNVVGALNSNLAFFKGMDDVGAFASAMGESEMLNEVWSQEPQIRADTTEWLFSFLALAYQPLDNDSLELYIDFSHSESGKLLNKALFEGFDDLFILQSTALGRLFGQMTKSEEL